MEDNEPGACSTILGPSQARSRLDPDSFPNSVWERTPGKLCFARCTAKRSFANGRSQTEFGNEGTREREGASGGKDVSKTESGNEGGPEFGNPARSKQFAMTPFVG